MPKPFHHRSGRWCVHYSPKLSPTGKDSFVYFDSEEAANEDLKARVGERQEHGRSLVTAQERQWVHYLRQQLGDDLKLLPSILEHWRATRATRETAAEDAVEAFLQQHLPEVDKRTRQDIDSRLSRFGDDFKGVLMHSLDVASVERWLHGFKNLNTRSSYWKRLAQFFDFCVRNRYMAENLLERLKKPTPKRASVKVYTPMNFQDMLEWANLKAEGHEREALLPMLALCGLCFMRTGEVVRLYSEEEVIRWDDILWDRRLVHVRAEVAKETRRADDERFIPFTEPFEKAMVSFMDRKEGRCVDILHRQFSEHWRTMHTKLGLTAIHNGLRKSCISYALAADNDLGVVQAARYAGNSETTIRKHYLERLTPEDGKAWFAVTAQF
jgi:site-specific recombinase XerD